jgi:hypothetical protein
VTPDKAELKLIGQGGYNRIQDYYGNYNFSGSLSNRFLITGSALSQA